MRLIDANELINYIKSWGIGEGVGDSQRSFINSVNKQPTAYDVDKVLEQLYRISDEEEDKISVCEEEFCLYHDGFSDGVDEAIEIVKGGVVYGKL